MKWTFLILSLLVAVAFSKHSRRRRQSKIRASYRELIGIVNHMRDADVNKAEDGQVVVDFQDRTTIHGDVDDAENSLFTHVDPALLQKPTYEKFIALQDNYVHQCGIEEEDTPQEEEEAAAFLHEVMHTEVWKLLYKFLHKKKHPYARNLSTFQRWIVQLWFHKYSRCRGVADSSGFEHVFIGESKKRKLSGMHNWLRFYLLERNASASFDYMGYLENRFTIMAAVKYSWTSQMKKVGTFLIGTSPEFDLALYTLCFLYRRGDYGCNIEIDGCPVRIRSFDVIQDGKISVGAVYPTFGRLTPACIRRHMRSSPSLPKSHGSRSKARSKGRRNRNRNRDEDEEGNKDSGGYDEDEE